MTSNMCPSCVSWNEFNDQHKQMRWVEHRAKMGGLSLTQTRYFYMLGPRWSAGCSNFHGEFNSFEDSTCKCHKCKAIQATDIPKQKNTRSLNVQSDVIFLWDTKQNQAPFAIIQATSPWWRLQLPTPFCRNHKSHLTSLCLQGFLQQRWVSLKKKRRKTMTNLNLTVRPCQDPTTFWWKYCRK